MRKVCWLFCHCYVVLLVLIAASTSKTTLAFTISTKAEVKRHGFLFPRVSTTIPVNDNNSKDDLLSYKNKQQTMTTKQHRASSSRYHHLSASSASMVAAALRPKSLWKSIRRQSKPIILAGMAVLLLVGFIDARRARQRQELDATSEWSRYAQHPAARGRAVMMMSLRLFPYYLKYLFSSKEKKREISAASGQVFANDLLRLGPLYIKLGQILSCRDNLLPTAWITAMERLQDRVPAQSGSQALELAHAAAGSSEQFDQLFSDFDDVPLAAASLGQVHRAVLRETKAPVAIKLQRPNLRQIYDQDLALLLKIAAMMDKIPSSSTNVGGVSQSWTGIFEDAKDILYREIDYRDEADNALRFNCDFGLGLNGTSAAEGGLATSLDGETLPSASSWLRAPHVYRDISTEQLLVMEYVPSLKITKATEECTVEQREWLADSLARTYLRCFCTNRFFSTDPHPGNLGIEFLGDKNNNNKNVRLVMYDFGQACELQPSQADGILTVLEAIIDYNSDKCVDAFAQMGVLKDNADLTKVRAKVQDNFDTGKITVQRKKLKKRGYVFEEKNESEDNNNNSTATTSEEKVKDLEVMGFFTLPAEYAFVARALTQMDGVGKTLDPDFDFISSAAPYIVEIKGAKNYLQDEWSKWVDNAKKQIGI